MNICILIYGIGRGVNLSSTSYRDNIYKYLQDTNIQFSTYYLLNSVSSINNPRSNDYGSVVIPHINIFSEVKRFTFKPSDFLVSELYEFSLQYKDRHSDNFISNRNLIFQLEMINKFHGLLDFDDFSHILLLRDDTIIDIDLEFIFNKILSMREALVFSKWGIENGISDRFVLGPTLLVLPIVTRVLYVKQSIVHSGYLNGEELMWFVVKKLSLPYFLADIKITRVRLDNTTKLERFAFPWWRPRDALFYVYNLIKLLFVR